MNKLEKLKEKMEMVLNLDDDDEEFELSEEQLKELRAEEEEIERLEKREAELDAQIQEAKKVLNDLENNPPKEYTEAKKKCYELSKEQGRLQLKTEKIIECTDAIEKLLAELGLYLGTDKSKNQRTIVFNGEFGECTLFFDVLKMTKESNGLQFEVANASPFFQEFDKLASEVNESQDLMALIFKSREYFQKHFLKNQTSASESQLLMDKK